jgi:putative membrane protein
MKTPIVRFIIRWFVTSLGLWIAAGLLSNRISYQDHLTVILVAGLILALINAVIKPIIVILSLPAILLSLGLFMIVVNGLMVYLVSKLYPALEITSFWTAILAGIIIGLVNYLVSTVLENGLEHNQSRRSA